ncbi:MAG: DUF368 domain-containing protein, partial [Clostridia bacterium]|nr:DUF368 domain-containing protein [Clostridia bacterium]
RGAPAGRAAAAAAAGMALALLLCLPGQGAQGAALSLPQRLLCGGIIAVGTVVPGVSCSMLLLSLGWYGPLLTLIRQRQWLALLPVIGAALLVGVLSLRAAGYLFRRFGAVAEAFTLGLTAASLVWVLYSLLPAAAGTETLRLLLLMLCGAALTFGLVPQTGGEAALPA